MTSSDENTDLPVPLSQSLDETLAYLFHKVRMKTLAYLFHKVRRKTLAYLFHKVRMKTLAYLFHKVNHSIAKFRISQKQQLNYEEADLSLISFKVSKNLHTKHSLFFSQHDKSSQSLNNFQQLLDALLICLHKNHTTT